MSHDSTQDQRPNVVTRILDWLRAGYPHGVPQQDYVALFGLLHRQLTPVEVDEIAAELSTEPGHERLDEAEIRRVITEHSHQAARPDDVTRVSSRLAAGGWPLAAAAEQQHDDA